MIDDPDDVLPPSWRQRPKPVGFEITYKLDGEALEIDRTRAVDRVRLSAVEQVRFLFAPGNISAKGYRTQLRLSDGRTITFGNLSWRSLTDLERDDARYHRFVSALAQAIMRANPRARFIGGRPRPLWLAMTLVGLLSLAMIAFFALRLMVNCVGDCPSSPSASHCAFTTSEPSACVFLPVKVQALAAVTSSLSVTSSIWSAATSWPFLLMQPYLSP